MWKFIFVLIISMSSSSALLAASPTMEEGGKAVMDAMAGIGRSIDGFAKDENHWLNKTARKGQERLLNAGIDMITFGADNARDQAKHERNMEATSNKISAIGSQISTLLGDWRVLGGITALVAGFFILKHGTGFARTYFESVLGKPNLVLETSRKTMKEKIVGKPEVKLSIEDIILPTDLKKDFVGLTKLVKMNQTRQKGYQHVLFYGPPGTGKTLGAKILAKSIGMEYAIIAGSAFSQFSGGKDIQELEKIIKWAEKTPGGIILFIDEASAAFKPRKGEDKASDNLVDYFLSVFERTTHPKIMLILATNHPEQLDPAILNRLSKTVYIGAPDKEGREQQIALNVKKILTPEGVKFNSEITPDYWTKLSDKMDGLVGRELFDFVIQLKNESDLSDTKELSAKQVDNVAQSVMQTHKDKDAMQNMLSKKHVYFNPNAKK